MNATRAEDRPRTEYHPHRDLVGMITDCVMIGSALTVLLLLASIAFPMIPLFLATLIFEALAYLSGGAARD